MFLCPRYCCRARVSWPSLASLNPQAWRSMCGWIGNGILAASPTRWMRRWKPMGLIWPAALGNEHVGVLRVIASYFTQSPHLVTADRMYAGNPVLDTVNVQAALGELDLLPLQVADLRRPQAMAVGHQDHGRVAMAVAAMLSGAVHQPLNLALGEVASLDCQVYDA